MADACTRWSETKSAASWLPSKILLLSYLSLVGLPGSGGDYRAALLLSIAIDSMLFWHFLSHRSDLWFYASSDYSSLLFLYLCGAVGPILRWTWMHEHCLGCSIGKSVYWSSCFVCSVERNRIHWETIDSTRISVIWISYSSSPYPSLSFSFFSHRFSCTTPCSLR